MYSLLSEIDKYLKENNIGFTAFVFHKSYFPDYINMAIEREIKKTCDIKYITTSDEYEFRYDTYGNPYFLIHDNRGKQNFVIDQKKYPTKGLSHKSGKDENHIIKMGCLFKILQDDIANTEVYLNKYHRYMDKQSRARLKYKLIDDIIEKNYKKIKSITREVLYKDDLIETASLLKSYIEYLNTLQNDDIKTKKRS